MLQRELDDFEDSIMFCLEDKNEKDVKFNEMEVSLDNTKRQWMKSDKQLQLKITTLSVRFKPTFFFVPKMNMNKVVRV